MNPSILQQTLNHDTAYVFISPVSRQYITGVSTTNGMVLITHDQVFFYTDFRYLELARQTAESFVSVQSLEASFPKQLSLFCEKNGIKKLIFEKDYLTVKDLENFKSLPILYDENDTLHKMRMVKSEKEMDAMRYAQQITDAAFGDILNDIHIGMTEKEVMAKLIYYMYHRGADRLSFDPIVVSGTNGALPHGVATEKVLREGEFLTMDFGVIAGGYCSDMTRTVALGHVTEKMQFVYDTVLTAQQKAMNVIKAGIQGYEVDAAARELIYQSGFKGMFGHSTGHGVGIEIHELPNFAPNYTGTIPENAVLSVEPGIYITGEMGVRIENVVKVTQNGFENLTKSSAKLLILK